jgi:hypothetical protein
MSLRGGRCRRNPRAVITAVLFIAIIGLAIWYRLRPEPLLVQGKQKAPGSASPRASQAGWRRSPSAALRRLQRA